MKKYLVLLALPFVLLLSGCEDSNGWEAIPTGDSEDEATCYQITEWRSDGWGTTKQWAKGIYCPADITPQEETE